MFPHWHGCIEDDFGNIIPLSLESWHNRFNFWYDTGGYAEYGYAPWNRYM